MINVDRTTLISFLYDLFVKFNIDLNLRDIFGNTILILAVQEGHWEVTQKLFINPQVDISIKDGGGKDALACAERDGQILIADMLRAGTPTVIPPMAAEPSGEPPTLVNSVPQYTRYELSAYYLQRQSYPPQPYHVV
jgi:hypothetical protein